MEKDISLGSAASQPLTENWLLAHGPEELEILLRAVVFHPTTPILLADNDRLSLEASVGVSKLLGVPREKIIGRKLDEFAEQNFRPIIPEKWREFLQEGQQEGTLHLLGPDGEAREIAYSAKGNVLPVRHLVVLSDKTSAATAPARDTHEASATGGVPAWVRDFALFLLDANGKIAAWYGGAERIYGYKSSEVAGKHLSFFLSNEGERSLTQERLKRAATEGHSGSEGWQLRKDGSRFWANVIKTSLKDERGELQGFAVVVRDFSDRHEKDEKLRRDRPRYRSVSPVYGVAGIVSGEYDRIPEANDAFLELVGYSRDDLVAGRLHWPELTPPEFVGLDEFAHEEMLRFGACTPFERGMIRKDGTQIQVLITTAVLKLSPFRWITFVTDLRERDRQESIEEEEPADLQGNFDEIIGTSSVMKLVLANVEVVAPTDATVLVLGETGTGKELIARAIHRISPRRNLPFISLNCAAIPTGLLESELFGYERGAFTGALSQKIGRFEMAHRGTLFLDEVGDIPLDLQPKLLRALQEKSFERLGGTRTIPIDVRLVAATNRNLTQMMGDKLFRSDLYYRLRVFPITTPPLREHPDDIPILARHFTKKYAEKMGRVIDKIPTETMKALVNWPWPGNVRELENFIERSVILSRGPALRAPVGELIAAATDTSGGSTLEEVEREYILRVFRETGGVVSATATRLGIPRTTLNAMMTKLGISREDL